MGMEINTGVSGVYEIKNTITNKIYIGSSKDVRERWNEHKRELDKNNHHSIHLQRAWNKYGEESFVFNLIEECNEDDTLAREQLYLDLLKPYDKNKGYNISKDASAPMKGRKHSKETMEILAEDLAHRDISTWLRGEDRPNSKLKDDDVIEIKKMIYERVKICDIAELFGVKPNTITQVKTGERWSHIETPYDDLIIQTPKQKLNNQDIIEIKKSLIENNLTITEIANIYGVSFGMVSAIKNLRSHKGIGEEFNDKLDSRFNVRKLNKDKIVAINKMISDGILYNDIAKEFDISSEQVRNVEYK